MELLDFLQILRPSSDFDGSLISEPIAVPLFDGKRLAFILNGATAESDDLNEYATAVINFLRLDDSIRLKASPLIVENYEYSKALSDSLGWVSPSIDAANIWDFVYPSEVLVSRRMRRDRDIYLQVHCECDWEVEHGLQLVFRRGLQLTRVSEIDDHDTESDARDMPDSEDVLLSKFVEK